METISFDYASAAAPLIVVQAQIGEDKAPSTVVLDTGATGPFVLFLSQRKAQALQLPLSDEKAPETSTAIGNAAQTYREATVSQFRLGPVRLAPANAAVMPMIDTMSAQVGRPIDAIIGYEALKSLRFTINYPKRRIALDPLTPSSVPLLFTLGAKKPMILVTAMVNGEGPFCFEIDTGASGTSISPEVAQIAGVKPNGRGLLAGAGGTVEVKQGKATITVGETHSELPGVMITDEMSEISDAVGSRIDGVLGLDVLYRTKLTIDYPLRQVWIE